MLDTRKDHVRNLACFLTLVSRSVKFRSIQGNISQIQLVEEN